MLSTTLICAASCGGSSGSTFPVNNCGHINASGFVLEQGDSTLVTSWNGDTRGEIRVSLGSNVSDIKVRFLSASQSQFAVDESCSENSLTLIVSNPQVAGIHREPGTQWTFEVLGLEPGSTTMTLKAWHEDHLHATYPGVKIRVEPVQ